MENISDTSERAKQSKAIPDNENDYTGPNADDPLADDDSENSESDDDEE
jgi:hypothetical protein